MRALSKRPRHSAKFVQKLFDIEPFFGRSFWKKLIFAAPRANSRSVKQLSARQAKANSNFGRPASEIKILEGSNQPGMAAHARSELNYYESLPEEVLRSHALLNEGRLLKAEELVKTF